MALNDSNGFAVNDSPAHPIGPEVQKDAERRIDLAREAAGVVAEMAMAVYQRPGPPPDRKEDGSVVTSVDRDGEARIRELIGRAFPDDAILGEEHGETSGSSGWRWVLDPIDGTRSFVHGMPSFCTLIGIEFEQRPVAGYTRWPALGESLEAVLGQGALWKARGKDNWRPARVSHVTSVAEATIQLGTPSSFERTGKRAVHANFAEGVRRIRGWDDGYAFALVATGRVDGAVQCGLSRWDLSAFVPIIGEAGGRLVSWTGGDPLESPGDVIAGPAELVHGLTGLTSGNDLRGRAD